MLLGVAWRDAGPEFDRMFRYESRLRIRSEKAIKRMTAPAVDLWPPGGTPEFVATLH